MAEVPASLKKIKPYLERGAEIVSRDPVVAYHCRLYALQEAMKLRKELPKADMGFILGLMDELEKEKAALGGEADDAQMLVENFGQDLFKKADDLDRSGQSDLRTGKVSSSPSAALPQCRARGRASNETWRCSRRHQPRTLDRAPRPPALNAPATAAGLPRVGARHGVVPAVRRAGG